MRKNCVVFTANEKFAAPLCAAITSLLDNNTNIIDDVYILHDRINISTQNKIGNYIFEKFGKKIVFYEIDGTIFDGIFSGLRNPYHFSRVGYFRYLLGDVLPKDIDTVLFLDVDLIVVGSIEEIFTEKFLSFPESDLTLAQNQNSGDNELYCYAVDHYCENRHKLILRDKYDFHQEFDYFNAGVMYINLNKWRKDNISKIAIDFSEKHKNSVKYPTQDVLNVLFQGRWGKLHPKYNVGKWFFHGDFSDTDVTDAVKNPVIIHFSGTSKPWHMFDNHPYKKIFWKYLRMTPYKFSFPNFSFNNLINMLNGRNDS